VGELQGGGGVLFRKREKAGGRKRKNSRNPKVKGKGEKKLEGESRSQKSIGKTEKRGKKSGWPRDRTGLKTRGGKIEGKGIIDEKGSEKRKRDLALLSFNRRKWKATFSKGKDQNAGGVDER